MSADYVGNASVELLLDLECYSENTDKSNDTHSKHFLEPSLPNQANGLKITV